MVLAGSHILTCVLVLSGCVTEIISTSREMRVYINPGCMYNNLNCTTWTNTSLIHIRSDGIDDTLHFIWSFNGSPSLLLARTSRNTTLDIDWKKFHARENNSIAFNGSQPIYTFAYTLNTVLIFDDKNDNVLIDKVNQTDVYSYNTKYFAWERQDYITIMSSSDVEFTFVSKQYQNHTLGPNGTFTMTVRAKAVEGYSQILPYMLHNSNMSQIDIDFSQVDMNYPEQNPNNSRVAFTFILVQGDEELGKGNASDSTMRFERVATLDDEHTPGVFSTMNIRSQIVGEYDQSFLQWKPICYTQKVRDISNSIDVTSYDLQTRQLNSSDPDHSLENSVLWAYYGIHLESLGLHSFNVSFGTKKDGFYNKIPHISWTFMTGFGTPPEDYVSLLVILVVCIGFGIPLLIILISSIYIIYRRLSKPRDEMLVGH